MSVLRPWSINRTPHISSRHSCTVCSHAVHQWFPKDLSMPQKIIGHVMRSPKRFGNHCYTQYVHTHRQTQQTPFLAAYPPLTSTQTVSALLLSGKLCVCFIRRSLVFSQQQRLPGGMKAWLSVSKSPHCLSILHFSCGRLLKSTVTDGGWWICSRGSPRFLRSGGGGGVIHPSSQHCLLPQLRIITHDASPPLLY